MREVEAKREDAVEEETFKAAVEGGCESMDCTA